MSSKYAVFYFANIDKRPFRFLLLIGAGCFGLLLGVFADAQFFCDYLGQDETVAKYLATAVVGVPVFMFLWYFRTRDVRQQIEKTQEQIDKFQKQINQDYFNHAVGNLTADNVTEEEQLKSLHNMMKEEVGIKSLIKLSEVTSEFNKIIIIAFENKIQEIEIYDFAYDKVRHHSRQRLDKYMKAWLAKHKKTKEE